MFTNVKQALEKNGFEVQWFKTKEEATSYLDTQLNHQSIGLGGSTTLVEMGLYDLLEKHNDVYWHQRLKDGLDDTTLRLKANSCDIYISSVNGLSEDGQIINIDNNCNRVAAIYYGHQKVYLVIGKNKLEKTFEKALYRARNIAAPLNAKRLNKKTPCALKADRCYNCDSEERICRGLSVLWKKPAGCDYEVILIEEDLGY